MRFASLPALVLLVALSGCGSSGAGRLSSDAGSQAPTSQAPTSQAPTSQAPTSQGPQAVPTAASACTSQPPTAAVAAGTRDLTKKPQIEVPDTPPPCNLVVGDVVAGTGAAARAGDPLTVKYVGVTYATGKQFDASWDRGQNFPFTLGAQMVIPGWDQGLVGMKVGGRRQLIIPPALAYGDQAQSADLPANSTLIFVVDLVKIG
ncbi:MAG: hypothetical protein NVS3B26_05900 [Mycobacteriales bacterium]